MGTSSSSSGPGSKIPFDPPWLDSLTLEIESSLEQILGNNPELDQNSQQIEPLEQNIEAAPPSRFRGARLNMGEYINSGDRTSLKKALGYYSRKGMGGASKVAKRMRTSTSVGAGLFNFLQEVRDSTDTNVRDWVNKLTAKNLSGYEIADEIINQVISSGGSLEEESCRNSMALAMSDLLMINPNIDLINMENDNIWTVIELFTANEAFNRLNLDIGQLFESSRYSPRQAVSRMNDMKEYLKSEISAQIQKLRSDKTSPTKNEIANLLQSALKITFEIFEDEI